MLFNNMPYNDCLADSSYSNPALTNYECDGQMSIFDFIKEFPSQSYIDNDNNNNYNQSGVLLSEHKTNH